MPAPNEIIYLKLGGSLITDKRSPETVRADVLTRIAHEIAAARAAQPHMRLVLGHGSGSFGHAAARRFGTRAGVHTPEEWMGYAITGDAAARLNRALTAALLAAGVPAWSIQPGATLSCHNGRIIAGPEQTVRAALARAIVPLVYGDVALDDVRGGTIASTEEIFEWLAQTIPPQRIILAGEVNGIYSADPQLDPDAQHIASVTPAQLPTLAASLGGSHGIDVTGGMLAKVQQSIEMVKRHPSLEIILCSGLQPGNIRNALTIPQTTPGVTPGTRIHADTP